MPDWSNTVVPERINLWTLPGNPLGVAYGAPFVSTANSWVTNQAMYVPFVLPWRYPVRRAFWSNGGIAPAHVDIGIYTISGARVWSLGGVAGGSGGVMAYGSLASPVVMSAGRYYFAMSTDGTNWIAGANPGSDKVRAFGFYQQASAYPLPAQATFAAWTAQLPIGLVGLMTSASGI